jgi:hypothetical protein
MAPGRPTLATPLLILFPEDLFDPRLIAPKDGGHPDRRYSLGFVERALNIAAELIEPDGIYQHRIPPTAGTAASHGL